MREARGDLFALAAEDPAALVVVTTNGALDRSGHLVMGAGVARQAKDYWPRLPAELGALVAERGNVPVHSGRVLTWPTKPDTHSLNGRVHAGWMCMSRFKSVECRREVSRLTAQSGLLLLDLVAALGTDATVLLPRPGCGLGGLDWGKVKPWMQERFSDQYVVVSPEE